MLSLLQDLSPHARVATAAIPFAIAMALRIVVGKNKLTRTLVTLGTMWFAINVLVAPYSVRMQQDIQNLRYIFR